MRGDATLDEVRRKFHVEHLDANLVVDLKYLQLKQASLKRSCSLETYLQECQAALDKEAEALKGTTDLLDLPPGLFSSMTDVMKLEATKIYANQVETAAKHHAAAMEEKQSKKDKEKKVLEEAASLEPKEVLSRAFESFIKGSKYYGKNRQIDYVDMLQVGVKPPVLQVTESRQKMGSPLGMPRGTVRPILEREKQRQEQNQAQQGQGQRQRKRQARQGQREEQGLGQRQRKEQGQEQGQGQKQRKRQGQPDQGEEQRQRQVRSGARSLARIRDWRAASRAARKRGWPDLSAAVLRLLRGSRVHDWA